MWAFILAALLTAMLVCTLLWLLFTVLNACASSESVYHWASLMSAVWIACMVSYAVIGLNSKFTGDVLENVFLLLASPIAVFSDITAAIGCYNAGQSGLWKTLLTTAYYLVPITFIGFRGYRVGSGLEDIQGKILLLFIIFHVVLAVFAALLCMLHVFAIDMLTRPALGDKVIGYVLITTLLAIARDPIISYPYMH